jgi:hypothetical protein
LFANINGHIEGDIVVFDKRYDGGGDYWQTVTYTGKLDAKAGRITGTWVVNSSSTRGTFEMYRIAKVHPTCSL